MDAFSVSCANALSEPHMHKKRACSIAGVYAGFQFLMPMIGWFCVHMIAKRFAAFQPFIPWIALILLLFIGGKMIYEALFGGEEIQIREISSWTLFVQGVATSIDALSVGFTISNYGPLMASTASVIIAAVTFVICMGGLYIGKKAASMLSKKAPILGGIILIIIGLEIFITGM